MDSKQIKSKPKLIPIPKNIRFQLPLNNLRSIPTPDPEIQEEYEQNTNSLTERDFNPDSQANASADTTGRFKEMIIEELIVIRIAKQCPVHPEEDLEFYSFTKGRALCAECLVSGNYVGHEVVNIKRAGEKIKKQFKDIVQETKDKVESYQKWEKKAEGRREQLLEVMKQYRLDIKKRFEELQRKIVEKENEIMEGIDQIKIEKEWEFEAFMEMVKKRQGEVFALQETLKGNLEDLDDVTMCSYYTKKEPWIRGFLKDTGNLEQKKVDGVLEKDLAYGGQWSLDKFEESFGIINGEVENMKGLEEIKRKIETIREDTSNKLSQKTLHLFAEWDQSSRRETQSDVQKTPLKSHIVPAIGPLARRGCSISITSRGENGAVLPKGKNDDIFGNYFDQIQKIRTRRNPSFSGPEQALLSARVQGLADKITVGGSSTARLLNTDRRFSRDPPGRLLTESSRSGFGENSHIKGHESQRDRQSPFKQMMMEEGSLKNAIVKGSYLPKGSGNENGIGGVVSPVRMLFTRPETPVIKNLQTYISSPVSPPNGNPLYEKMKSIQRKGSSNLGN